MRKIIIPIICILLLCSCATKSGVKPENKSIGFTAVTQWENTEYEINAISTTEETVFTIISPEKIRNLKLAFSGDSVNLYYLELEQTLSVSQLPASSPFRVTYEGLKKAKSENASILQSDNKYYLEYTVEDNEYLLFFGETGLPLEIKEKDGNSIILFKGVTILN